MSFRYLSVDGERICSRSETPCNIVRKRATVGCIAHADLYGCRDCCNFIAGSHLIAVRQITIHGLAAAKLQREFRRAVRKRARWCGHHVSNVARRTVRKRRCHNHPGFVKGFSGAILCLIRLLCDLNRFNASAERHKIGRVIFKVNRAVAVCDRTADRVLRLIAIRRKNGVWCLIGIPFVEFLCGVIS